MSTATDKQNDSYHVEIRVIGGPADGLTFFRSHRGLRKNARLLMVREGHYWSTALPYQGVNHVERLKYLGRKDPREGVQPELFQLV